VTLGFDERDRASVMRDLASPDEDVRRLAVERAEALSLEASLPLLVERLGDTSWRVRKAAVERLVACADTERLAAALIGALADGDNPGRRNGAVEGLVLCGPRVVPALLAACRSPDPDVRKLVVDSLAGVGEVAAADTLVALLEDPDANVRAAAADALGALGAMTSAAPLLARAGHEGEDPLVRFSALRALGALGAPVTVAQLAPALDDAILRSAALDLLGGEDEPEAVSVLLKALAASSRSARESAMRALLRLLGNVDAERAAALREQIRGEALASPELVEDAVEHLEEGDLPTRLVLVQFLGLLRCRPAVLPLLRAARDEALAEVALATLGSFGLEVEACLEEAWDELDSALRALACDLFGRTHGERGALLLASALESAEAELRMAAARGVARRGALGALALLVRRLELVVPDDEIEAEDERGALSDAIVALAATGEEARARVDAMLQERLGGASDDLRVALAGVLARIAPPEDAPVFLQLLKDPSADVRRVAVEALGRLDADAAAEPLRLALADEEASVRIAAAAALGAGEGSEALRDLRSLADDHDPRVRATAVRGIARHLDGGASPEARERARETLLTALEDHVLVALAALEALHDGGGALASAAAGALARPEPEVVREAVRCVGRHGEDEALDVLLPLVSHEDWSVRAEVIGVLAERRVLRAVPAILRRLESEQDEFVRGAILKALERLEG
jgi:HEAT repeat protein